jgi:hypothetical protein
VKSCLDLTLFVYTFLKILPLTFFEKMPILRVFSRGQSQAELFYRDNRLNLFDS